MPTYTYACNICSHSFDLVTSIRDRDNRPPCPECTSRATVRLSAAPSFSIKGFNAANGYAKARQDR